MDNNDNIILEYLYNSYEYTPETSNLLFSGEAILINHQLKTRSITFLDNAADVTDKLIGGPKHIGIHYQKVSKTQDIKAAYVINESINIFCTCYPDPSRATIIQNTIEETIQPQKNKNKIRKIILSFFRCGDLGI